MIRDGSEMADEQASYRQRKAYQKPRLRTIDLTAGERERGTLTQSKSEGYPAEYGSLIEQYLKNLSDRASGE